MTDKLPWPFNRSKPCKYCREEVVWHIVKCRYYNRDCETLHTECNLNPDGTPIG